MNRIQLLLSTSLLTCAVVAQPAFAQNATAQAPASAIDRPKDSEILEEVLVTAERRTSTAQRTAASLTVKTGEEMLTKGRYELKNILEDVPGVVGGAALNTGTSQGSGTDNPASGLTIRGIQSNVGAGGSTTSTSAAAAIYVDDVYNGIGGGYDLDRIEVLRGPQGTLYGRSATAGVVAIHAKAPNSTLFSVDGTAELGNYNLRHYTGGVNIPIVEDKLAVRIAGNLYERDGYYSAEGGATKTAALRVKALWTPTDNFSALFGYAQEHNKTHSGGVTVNQVGSPTDFVYTSQEVATGKNHSRQYWANLNLELGSVAITYIPAYRTWYQNATTYLRGLLSADQTLYTPTDSFTTHELRIHNTDNDAKLKWQTGLLYYNNKIHDINQLNYSPSGDLGFKSESRKTTEAIGAFAEGIWSVRPDTRLTVGLRFDHTEVQNNQDYTSILGITKSISGADGLRKFDNTTYKLRLEHDLTPANLIYGSIATGFSPGDVTLTTDANFQPVKQILEAEILTAYEIGSKNRFLDNRLQLNGAAFYYDYGGYQTAGINTSPETPLTPTYATISLPMKSYGAELEVQARPWDDGTVSFNASYTHARYTDLGQYTALFTSKTVPGVAPIQGSVGYDHHIGIGNANLMLHGDVRFFSAHNTGRIPQNQVDAGGAPYVRVASQAVGNLNATLLFGARYSITAYVRNVTDNRFIPDGWALSSVVPSAVSGGAPTVTADAPGLSDPRTFGVVFNFKY